MLVKKQMTEEKALINLAAKCATTEYCKSDIKRMMAKWDLPETVQNRILERLQKEDYINEKRYAHAFVRDKFRYNHWGLLKIERELKLKGIDQDIIDHAKTEISQDAYMAELCKIINTKKKTIKGDSDFEIKGKLFRFAVSRGFSIDIINKVLHTDFNEDRPLEEI